MRIAFIGQGWIGKNYSDDFEERGYSVVRYALEAPYNANKELVKECNIVFIAVPTPTTPKGFDDSIVRSAVGLTRPGAIIVIKSTMQPGTTAAIQRDFADRIIMHSPEFLREAHAAQDARNPTRNLIGITTDEAEHRKAAEAVLSILPRAPYERVMPVEAAELVKCAGNVFLYQKVVFANILSDLSEKLGLDYSTVREAMGSDPRIGHSHLTVEHESRPGEIPARGAGGHCFIKDYAAFRALYEQHMPDDAYASAALKAIEQKNVELLKAARKDLDLLEGVYGPGLAV
jgi:nucleotide sugar dehydrogenase